MKSILQFGYATKTRIGFKRSPVLKFLYLFAVLALAGLKADAAEIYSNTVYKGIGTSYGVNTNSIQISAATLVAGSNFSFISLDPNDPLFVGNNVPGFMTYKNSSGVLVTIKGVVSRVNKNGNTGQSAYFYVVDLLGNPTGDAYLIIFPGFEPVFAGGGSFSSASSGVSDVLNVVLLESPRINVAGTLAAVAGCGGQASTPQTLTVDGANLTANIIITAPAGYEISLTSGSGYTTSLSLTPVSGTVPSTTLYVRLTSTAINGATGDVSLKSTGAGDRAINTGIATITGAPTISVSPASPSNYPGGTTSLTASGAVTYTWSPATALSATTGATVNATPLVTTVYTVQGTSSLGCIGSTTVTVTTTAALAGGSVSASQSICTGTAPAALTSTGLASGGSATYTYQWQSSSDNVTFADIPSANSLGYAPASLTATTYYRRKVSDAVTSAFSNSVTITVNDLPSISVSPASATIFPLGSIALTASGASTYSWSPAAGLSASTGATVTASPAATETFTVVGTSADGCSASTTVTVTVGAGLAAGSISANQAVCANVAPAALLSTAAASGGSASYTYQWQSSPDNVTFTDIPGASGVGYTPGLLSATTYFRRKVSDAVNSAFSNSVTITVYDVPAVGVSPATATIFPGGSRSLTAFGASTYSWSPSTGLSATIGAVVSASPAATTTYTVVGTSADGCIAASVTSVITVGPALTAGGIAGTQAICDGATSATLTSTSSAAGGSGVYIYQWQSSSDNLTFTDIVGENGETYTPGALSATTYFRRKVSDAVAVMFTNTVTVTVNVIPAVGVSPASVTIYPGEVQTLTAFGASTYAWSPSTGLSATTGAAVSASPAAATTYTVVGTSAAGCTASATVLVNVGPALNGGQISASQAICSGTVPAALATTTAVTGGSGVYAYQWQSSTDNVSFSDIPGAIAEGYAPGALVATTYFKRKANDAVVSVFSNTVTITVNDIPAIGVFPSSATIFPGGNRSVTAFGASTYSWSPATGLSASTGAVVVASPAAITTYTVVGTSVDGCSASATVTITVGPGLTAGSITSGPGVNQSICTGTAPTGFTETVAVTGGSGVYTYQWQSSADNVSFTDIVGATSSTYAPGILTATTYFRRKVSDGVASEFSNSITVTVNALPVVSVSPASTTIFPGGNAALTASGASTYSWSPATGLSASTGATVTASPAATETFTVIGTSAAGCTSSTTVTVTVGAGLAAGSISANQAVCADATPAALQSTAVASGGSASYTYQWQSSMDNVTFTDISSATGVGYTPGLLSATTYFRRKVSDAVTSAYSNTITVTVFAVPTVAVFPSTSTIFPGGSRTLTASGASTYSWSPATGLSATTGAVVSASPAATTTYTVVGTSADGCTASASSVITLGPVLTSGSISSGSGVNQSICTGTAPTGFTETVPVSGGSGVYAYQWQRSSDNVNFTDIAGATSANYAPGVLSATTYFRRKVSDAAVSVFSNTITVTVNPLPVLVIAPPTPSIFPGGDVTITASGASTYSWSPSTGLSATTGATVLANPAVNTTYIVTGTSADGCVSTASMTVTVGPGMTPGTIAQDQIVCRGATPDALTSLTAPTGGSGSYTYQWQSSTDNVNFTDIPGATSAGYTPGAITATTHFRRKASDAANSVFSNTVTITFSNESTPVITAAGATTFCTGGSVALTSSAAASYAWYLNNEAIVGATNQTYMATAPGNYTVITANANNCKSNESVAKLVVVNVPPTTPLAITGDSVVIAGYPYTYTATGSPSATSYTWTLPSGWSGASTNASINATPNSTSGTISVVAVANGCSSPAATYKVRVRYDRVTIPDVITPNNDGFNDKWKIMKPASMKVSVAIFNRWGQQVYKNTDYQNNWDGSGNGGFLGNLLPNGTYFYVVELSGSGNTNKEVMKGSITLKRD